MVTAAMVFMAELSFLVIRLKTPLTWNASRSVRESDLKRRVAMYSAMTRIISVSSSHLSRSEGSGLA